MSDKTINHPTFGMVLRGYRLGWAWSKKHQCFIRITGSGPDYKQAPYRIELFPCALVPSGKDKNASHVCWWDEPSLLDDAKPLKDVRGVKRHVAFYVGEDGELISKAA